MIAAAVTASEHGSPRRGEGTEEKRGAQDTQGEDLQRWTILENEIRMRMKNEEVPVPFLLLDPRKSRIMRYWEVVTGTTLIFIALVTPVEVGFMAIPQDRWSDGLFITNRCVDIIFIIDLLMQFFIMCARLRARDESRALPAALCRSTDCLPYPSRAPRTGTRCPTTSAIRAKSGSRLGARSRGTI
jgi:hypothetical protein